MTLNERTQSLRLTGIASKLLITLLAMSAGFTVYVYIYLGPMLADTMHANADTLAWVLVVFGLAGALGNTASVAQRLSDVSRNRGGRLT